MSNKVRGYADLCNCKIMKEKLKNSFQQAIYNIRSNEALLALLELSTLGRFNNIVSI